MQLLLANAEHLIPYVILLAIYFFLSLQSELLRNRAFSVPALGLLLFFAGLREVMTPDMERYRDMYEDVGALNAISVEPSFFFISKLLNVLGFDYHALFFTYTLITLLFLYLGIKNYTNQIKLPLLLYILLPGCFLNMFVEMRQVSAAAIAFYATSLLGRSDIKFRTLKCLIFAALSVSFHYSAIIYWIILFISQKIIKKTYSFTTYLFFIVLSLLIPTSVLIYLIQITAYPFLPAKYQAYINIFLELQTSLAGSGQFLKSLIYTLLAMCFIHWQTPRQDKSTSHIPLNLFVFGVIILNLTRDFGDLTRLAYFFLIFQIVLFPLILARMKDRNWQPLASYSLVLFYLAQFTWGLFSYSEEAGSYVFLHYRNALLSALQ